MPDLICLNCNKSLAAHRLHPDGHITCDAGPIDALDADVAERALPWDLRALTPEDKKELSDYFRES
jgi:hypothetical protein